MMMFCPIHSFGFNYDIYQVLSHATAIIWNIIYIIVYI